jgi:hypothetical protein
MLNVDTVMQELIAERDRLTQAIGILQGGLKIERSTAISGRPGRRSFTPAQKKAQAAKMKLYWAKRRRTEKKTSVAPVKRANRKESGVT